MYDTNENSVNKLFKKGQDALKTSIFSLKFSPDYLSAVSYFTDAAKGFKKLKMYKESLKAFEEAIKCNRQLLENWAEGINWQEMADICLFCLPNPDFNTGLKYLKNSSMSYKLSDKFTSGIKVYIDFSQRLIETKANYLGAATILNEAFDDCLEHTHDELIRISLEESFNALLDVYCSMEKYVDAINLIEKYIQVQKTIKDERKHKISKNYLKLGMLRIIIDEAYMAQNLVEEMYTVYDPNCSDDIDDLRKLIKAFEEGNKKDFTYLVTYAFSLFQNNLLKALKKAFDAKSALISSSSINTNITRINNQNIIVIPGGVDAGSSMDFDETKANSEFDTDMQSEFSANTQNQNNPHDEYL
jgi:tetratricopeptide (TPR) repeat protein